MRQQEGFRHSRRIGIGRDCLVENLFHADRDLVDLAHVESLGRSPRVNSSLEEDFVGVNVADAGDSRKILRSPHSALPCTLGPWVS
jgi:hypothetical protein